MSGDRLGSRGPAVPVETSVGATKPSLLGKLFGRKPTPGVVIYVCCPECAAKVKDDGATYALMVISERGRLQR